MAKKKKPQEWNHRRITRTKLLNCGHNHKTVKGDDKGKYYTGILYLAPGDISGHEMCPSRSRGCFDVCLYHAGWGTRPAVQEGRIRDTLLLKENPTEFFALLWKDIEILIHHCNKWDVKPAVRLNATSDEAWARLSFERDGVLYANIMEAFPGVQFYDYTKRIGVMRQWLNSKLPPNYHITFSLNEINAMHAQEVLRNDGNVCVVFEDELPKTYWGYPVVDGDSDDLRFLDPAPCIVGVKYKPPIANGKGGHRDETGFVKWAGDREAEGRLVTA